MPESAAFRALFAPVANVVFTMLVVTSMIAARATPPRATNAAIIAGEGDVMPVSLVRH